VTSAIRPATSKEGATSVPAEGAVVLEFDVSFMGQKLSRNRPRWAT
jgi:hypothetical protein